MKTISEDYLHSLSTGENASNIEMDATRIENVRRSFVAATSGGRIVPESFISSVAMAEQGRVFVLCAEPGMGRTTLLLKALEMCTAQGHQARYDDYASLSVRDMLGRLGELLRWTRQEVSLGERVTLALDNLSVGDEADADQVVHALRELLSCGANVIACILPEGEMLVEMMGEASAYWSCNLRLARPADEGDALRYDALTQGVPRLVDALAHVTVQGAEPGTMRMGCASVDCVVSDPGYQQAYARVVASCFRTGMMREEQKVRAAMILYGHGSFAEVENVVGKMDCDLWRTIARDAPFFGVDGARESFRCAGADTRDGLSPIYAWLNELVSDWSDVVMGTAESLAKRGEFTRSALVSTLCDDRDARRQMVLRWAPEFINAGELGLVTNALDEAKEAGLLNMTGFAEAERVLCALTGPMRACVGYLTALDHEPQEQVEGRFATLALRCRAILGGVRCEDAGSDIVGGRPSQCPSGRCEPCADALALIIDGRLEDAFKLLVDEPGRLSERSLVSLLLQMEYVLCSLLMGVIQSQADFDALGRMRGLLDNAELSPLAGLYESLLPLALLLAGRKVCAESFEAYVHRAARMGDLVLQGAYLLASALLDVRANAFVRAHVRLGQAREAFDAASASYLAKVARLFDACVRQRLDERVLRSDILACRGEHATFNKVTTIVLAATSSKRGQRAVGSGHWDLRVCPRDIHWIVNILMGDFGPLSRRVREVIPRLWCESVDKASSEVDMLAERVNALSFGLAGRSYEENGDALVAGMASSPEATDDGHRVHINALGGLEVRVDGHIVGNTGLERRRAKSMLALLVALPGHAAKRFTIMESVWPEYDYETGHRCVYSATSVLRTEVSEALGGPKENAVVFSNRTDRTVQLNMRLVTCDVDVFEEKAHRVLDSEGDHRLIVGLCRDIEDLYKGNLFVPPTDGAGIVGARSRELRGLYSDAMVAGAEAAMQIGAKMLACRFAKKAHEADDMREDAMRVLLGALCAAGRQVEAERTYERYASHVIDVTRRPPSRSLRQTVAELIGQAKHELPSPDKEEDAVKKSGSARFIDLGKEGSPQQLAIDLGEGFGTAASA